MDKKTIIAVIVSIGILLIWQYYFMPKSVQTPPTPVQSLNDNISNPLKIQELNTQTIQIVDNASEVVSAENIIIESNLLAVAFDSFTGDIKRASILGWKDLDNESITFNKGNKTDYIRILTSVTERPTIKRSKVNDEEVISFTSSLKGLIITKEYRIAQDSYLIKSSVRVVNSRNVTLSVPLIISIGPGLGSGFEKSSYIFEGAVLHSKGKTERIEIAKDKTAEMNVPIWAGYSSKYFLVAVATGNFEKGTIAPITGGEVASLSKSITINPDSNYLESFDIYVGPKDYNGLKVYGLGLEDSIDFGWFYFLAIPMLQFLLFIAGIVKNYGVAIIILTIIIKIVTLPLTMKGMKSMKAMTKLQPEMAKLKEKFKDDPQKMNTATMELYKKNKVNPMSGCLPLLIQIPIFFALYKALLLSIELKGAPFIFYLTDLSAKDPYYITPIIMGASMFLQQKLTPSTADPMQQKIFLFMPIVFTVLFLNFPSGLVIYWLTNNILSIIQQLIVNKSSK